MEQYFHYIISIIRSQQAAVYLQSLGHDEEGEGEAEADDEDTGHHQLGQQPGVQEAQSWLQIFLIFFPLKYFLVAQLTPEYWRGSTELL